MPEEFHLLGFGAEWLLWNSPNYYTFCDELYYIIYILSTKYQKEKLTIESLYNLYSFGLPWLPVGLRLKSAAQLKRPNLKSALLYEVIWVLNERTKGNILQAGIMTDLFVALILSSICTDSRCPLTYRTPFKTEQKACHSFQTLFFWVFAESKCPYYTYLLQINRARYSSFFKERKALNLATCDESLKSKGFTVLQRDFFYVKLKFSELLIISWWKSWKYTLVCGLNGAVSVTVLLEFHTFGLKEGIRKRCPLEAWGP